MEPANLFLLETITATRALFWSLSAASLLLIFSLLEARPHAPWIFLTAPLQVRAHVPPQVITNIRLLLPIVGCLRDVLSRRVVLEKGVPYE